MQEEAQRGWSGCEDETKTVPAIIGESYTHTHTPLPASRSLPPLPEIKTNEIRLRKGFKCSSVHVLGKKNTAGKKKKKKGGTLSLPSLLNLIDC